MEGKAILGQGTFQFLQLRVMGLVSLEVEHSLHKIDNRVQGGVLVIRGAPALQPGMRRVGDMVFHHLH